MADLGEVGLVQPGIKRMVLPILYATGFTFPPSVVSRGSPKQVRSFDVWAAKNIALNPVRVQGEVRTSYLGQPLPQDWKTFSGTVVNSSGNPAARTVRVVRRSDGYELGETTSSASTGAWSITVPATSEVQILCLDDAAGTLENDLIHRVLPA